MWCEPGQSAGEATLDTESPNVLGATTVYGTTSLPGFSDGRGSLPPAAGDFQAGVRKAKTPAVEVPALPTQQKSTVPRPQVSPATFCPQRPRSGTAGQHPRADSGPHRSVTASGDVQQQSPVQGLCGHLLSRALGHAGVTWGGKAPPSCRVKCSDSIFPQQCWALTCPHLGHVLQQGRHQLPGRQFGARGAVPP